MHTKMAAVWTAQYKSTTINWVGTLNSEHIVYYWVQGC